MKKIFLLVLVSLLAISVAAGCGKSDNPEENQNSEMTEETTVDNSNATEEKTYTEEETLYIDVTKDINEQFEKNPEAKCVVISDGAIDIPRYGFSNRASVETFVLPDSVTEIMGNAFNDCSALTDNIKYKKGKTYTISHGGALIEQ